MTGVLLKRGNLGIHTKGGQWEETGRRQPCDQNNVATGQEYQGLASKSHMLEKTRVNSPLELPERA